MHAPLRTKDLVLALVVILVWGVNFAVIKVGVVGVPPLLLAALRFMLAAFPALLFFKAPKVPLRLYLLYGLTISVGQFSLLFTAIHVGMPTGLASLVLQSQAFFTTLLAAFWLKERWQANQMAGLLLAAVGLVLIG
ncbi:MAG: EamA family transporter, partial [Rhodoferax sp.]